MENLGFPDQIEDAYGKWDPEGKYIYYADGRGQREYQVKLYNHRGWVAFKNGEPLTYGVFLRTRRRRTKLDIRVERHPHFFLMREFTSDGFVDSQKLFKEEDIERLVAWWNERTLTGIKIVSLFKMELSQHKEAEGTEVALTEFYLGKYKRWDNPYQYGYSVMKDKKEQELRVKRRQHRKKHLPPKNS